MAYKTFRKGMEKFDPAKHVERFTFPSLDLDLDEEIVKKAEAGPALDRLGALLLERYKRAGAGEKGHPTIGVKFIGLDFVFLLGDDPKPQAAP